MICVLQFHAKQKNWTKIEQMRIRIAEKFYIHFVYSSILVSYHIWITGRKKKLVYFSVSVRMECSNCFHCQLLVYWIAYFALLFIYTHGGVILQCEKPGKNQFFFRSIRTVVHIWIYRNSQRILTILMSSAFCWKFINLISSINEYV